MTNTPAPDQYPDEFGLRRHNPSPSHDSTDPTALPNLPIFPEATSIHNEIEDEVYIEPILHLDSKINRVKPYRPQLEISRQYYLGLFESNNYGSRLGPIYAKNEESSPKPPPQDPYPSRAGWRHSYLGDHDVTTESKDTSQDSLWYTHKTVGDFEVITSDVTFDDVGGNAKPKEVLQSIVEQFKDPETDLMWDAPVPKGVLLYGETGTGKTMVAKAFANAADAAFIEVPVSGLRDAYFGETEKKLKKIFDNAAEYDGKVVIFFDEIDALLPNRSRLSASHPDALLVNTFLQAMDGMKSARNIMVLGATNYPHRLDEAAVRPGRFDIQVAVEMPDEKGARDILARQLLAAEKRAKRPLTDDNLDLFAISPYLQGFSGADIAEIVNRVKRNMAQSTRILSQAAILEDAVAPQELPALSNEEKQTLCIDTSDIIGTAIGYRLDKVKNASKRPPTDEPPTIIIM